MVELSETFSLGIVAAIAFGMSLGILLIWLRPADRASVRNALGMLGICAVAVLIGTVIGPAGASKLGRIGADIVSILTALILIRLVGMTVFRVLLPALQIRGPRIVEDLVVAALCVSWGFVWLRLAGVDLTSLVTTSAVITAVVAFSMQDTLGNILGGVVLQLDDSIAVGDWVRIDDISGKVVEIRWRHTAVETRNRETVMVPNSWLMKNRFSVIGSRLETRVRWRRWVWVNVDLAAPPTQVCAVLERVVNEASIDNVARDPPPSAVLMDVEAGFGRYAVRYWLIDPQPDDLTDSYVRAHVLAALARQDMAIGIPLEERLILKDNDARRAALKAEELAGRRTALSKVDLFKTLSEPERETLVSHLVYAPFIAGDVITRQGAVAHWLYLIVSGEADIWIESTQGRQHVNTLTSGSVFGEMGMMTGQPRRASVTAKTDVECYRLDKDGFAGILRARPDIAEEMSKELAARARALEEQSVAVRREKAEPPRRDDVLALIRSFFRLEG